MKQRRFPLHHGFAAGFCIGLFALVLPGAIHAASSSRAAVDFQREVMPILSKHCLQCHGPDDKSRKGGLRLDQRESAIKAAKSGERAIVPGKPATSELVHRINTTDQDDLMPPPEAKKPLTPEQKEILRKWIAAGADYTPHWAFLAPKQAPLPKVKNKRWPLNEIDYFILARLEKEKLKPSAEADRYTLVRRLYLDLIGLPPSPEEVDAFVNDRSLKAYEHLVDSLLNSPRYGERWARRWLDLARYADTNGYEKDRPRSIWPYRDWVIKALNDDMPFDQFTLKQIAGDMLPQATLEDRVATGFHRNSMLNEEGGIDPMEFRFYAMTDRVATTGATWLGLTLNCVQCHTHKYDPIQHKEYYQIMAFLDNADEPDLDLPDAKIATKRQEIEAKLAGLNAGLASKLPAGKLEPLFAAWLKTERERAVKWQSLKPVELKANLALLEVQPDNSVFASGDQSKVDTYELKFHAPAGVKAVRLEAIPDDSLPGHGPGAAYYEGPKGDFFLGEFKLSNGAGKIEIADATESYSKNNFGKTPVSAKLATDGDPQTGWSCAGAYGERHEAVFNLKQPLEQAGELNLTMLFGRHYACPLGRFRISVTIDERASARAFPDEVQTLLTLPEAGMTAAQLEQLKHQFLLSTPELATARAEIEKLEKSLPDFPTAMVMRERPPQNPRATFIHKRGEFLQPTERVEPGVLSILQPLPESAPRNRLGFARWLVATDNPLVGRVTVNRQWQAFFGSGLVRTLADFGTQGEPPSHPELLDWLAVNFIKQGWSVKKLHKFIVMSATYRQDSRVAEKLLAKDPENRLLARGPRVRLEAELVRDIALKISGVLSDKIGGPSVFPPQPASVTAEGVYAGKAWNESQGEDRYRRGLYTFAKRSAPYAMFSTFDAPSGESCTARRDVSDTPLQALTLLNDAVFVELSQATGKMMAARGGTVDERVIYLFRRFLARSPTRDEQGRLAAFYTAQKARFDAKELNATAIAGKGDGSTNERAAWTSLARAMFNLDELITKN